VPFLPESGFANPKERSLALTFRSMARCRMGDVSGLQRALEQAYRDFAGPFPYSDRVMTSGEADPAAWCMIQAALREAESLLPAHSR
jgi:hypothetical protein